MVLLCVLCVDCATGTVYNYNMSHEEISPFHFLVRPGPEGVFRLHSKPTLEVNGHKWTGTDPGSLEVSAQDEFSQQFQINIHLYNKGLRLYLQSRPH